MIAWLRSMFRRKTDPAMQEARREDLRVLRKVGQLLPQDESIRQEIMRAERAMRGESR